MFRVPAAEVLRRPDILRRLELSEEVIVFRPIERTFAVDRGFTDHPGLVNVVILEGIIQHPIGEDIAVMMAVGAARATNGDFVAKEFLTARDLNGFGLRRGLGQRVGEKSGLVLRPKNLEISHVVIAHLEGVA